MWLRKQVNRQKVTLTKFLHQCESFREQHTFKLIFAPQPRDTIVHVQRLISIKSPLIDHGKLNQHATAQKQKRVKRGGKRIDTDCHTANIVLKKRPTAQWISRN